MAAANIGDPEDVTGAGAEAAAVQASLEVLASAFTFVGEDKACLEMERMSRSNLGSHVS